MHFRVLYLWEKIRFLLYPLSLIYRIGLFSWNTYWKFKKSIKLPSFTIVVGNLTMGGTGKTPLVLYLAERLRDRGYKIAILSRGYGRKTKELKVLSKNSRISVKEVGDEPFLLHKKLNKEVPVVINKNRIKGAEVAWKIFRPDIFILDDAYQYRKIAPDLRILILDPAQIDKGIWLIPVGPWREPIGASKHADLVIFNFKARAGSEIPDLPYGINTFKMKYIPLRFVNSFGKNLELNSLRGRFFVFSGIADPLTFIDSLKRFGFEIVDHEIYIDHYWYTEKDIKKLILKKEKSGADFLLTTEKDMVRIERSPEDLFALEVKIEIEDEDEFWRFVDERLSLYFSESEKSKFKKDDVG